MYVKNTQLSRWHENIPEWFWCDINAFNEIFCAETFLLTLEQSKMYDLAIEANMWRKQR